MQAYAMHLINTLQQHILHLMSSKGIYVVRLQFYTYTSDPLLCFLDVDPPIRSRMIKRAIPSVHSVYTV